MGAQVQVSGPRGPVATSDVETLCRVSRRDWVSSEPFFCSSRCVTRTNRNTGLCHMSADRTPYVFLASPEEIEDAEGILRDLEDIIFEILPPAQAEAAYVATLQHLLKLMGGDAILATDRVFEKVASRRHKP